MIDVEDVVGRTLEEILADDRCVKDSYNVVNCTVELKDVKIEYAKCLCNMFLYFDLADRSTMVLGLIKINGVSRLQSILLNKKATGRLNKYVLGTSKITESEWVVSYTHEKIISAI